MTKAKRVTTVYDVEKSKREVVKAYLADWPWGDTSNVTYDKRWRKEWGVCSADLVLSVKKELLESLRKRFRGVDWKTIRNATYLLSRYDDGLKPKPVALERVLKAIETVVNDQEIRVAANVISYDDKDGSKLMNACKALSALRADVNKKGTPKLRIAG